MAATETEVPAVSATAPEAEAERMAALDRARLPVTTLAEAVPHLRRPFTPEAIRFKVQSVFKQQDGTPFGCLIVAYIDARLASERLNRVIPSEWKARYEVIPGSKLMWCHLTIGNVTRSDVGESLKGLSKDLVSDSLKRAAVHFGVGVSCYALPQISLKMAEARGRIEIRGKDDKRTIALTEHGHVKLREGYAKWLAEHGIERFGPPLDHGDVVGATIAEEYDIGAGEGDGSAPGWEGVSPERVEEIEALLGVAEAFGSPLDLATVQVRLNGQPDEVVQAWIADTRDALGNAEKEGGGS